MQLQIMFEHTTLQQQYMHDCAITDHIQMCDCTIMDHLYDQMYVCLVQLNVQPCF